MGENMAKDNFITLSRKILKWEWYDNIPVKVLFIHCLLRANWDDANWHGIEIKRGSFVTSIRNLAQDTGLTEMQVRTALKKLKLTQEITHKTTSRNTIITVKNYNQYQDNNTNNNKQITNKQQTNNKQITTNKEEINNNKQEINNKYIYSEKVKKIDKFNNPYIDAIKKEYKNVFGKSGMLTAENLNKISELAENNPDFMETIPETIRKLKRVDFSEIGYNAKTLCWLFSKDHYEQVYSGTWDFETREEVVERLRNEELQRRKEYAAANSNRPSQ